MANPVERPAAGCWRVKCTNPAAYRIARMARPRAQRNTCRRHLAALVDDLAGGDTIFIISITDLTREEAAANG